MNNKLLHTFLKSDLSFISISFLVWRLVLLLFLFFSLKLLPLQENFLGGGQANYLQNPYLWSWLNFDGEHYLSLAREGYKPLTYFFFPLFPVLIRLVAKLFSNSILTFSLIGLLISNSSFLLSLVGVYKLISLDFSKNITRLTILLLLLFPSSFYFGSYYNESIFLALSVWSFYFARKNDFLLAGALGGLAAMTRLVGIVLFPALVVEYFLTKRPRARRIIKNYALLGLILIPLGVMVYVYYVFLKTGDPLEFIHSVSIYGPQRSARLIPLPQVYYRYVFKIIPNISNYWPQIFVTILEFLAGSLFLFLTFMGYFKLRLSYWIFLLGAYLIPTFSGSFSSMPRYVLPLFPGFVLMALYLSKLPKVLQAIIFGILFIGLALSTAMFTRGYWVS